MSTVVADDKKLVKVMECHHVLWDNRMKEFRDKRMTQLGWKSVSEILGREVDDVMHRWSIIRKQYSRRITKLRQKKETGSPDKPWHLMPLLAFLRPCITPRRKSNTNFQRNNSTSSEEVYSSYQSDDSREPSPLVVRLNPVEPPKTSLFYDADNPQSTGINKRPYRPLFSKPKTSTVSEQQDTSQPLDNKQEENIAEPSSVSTKNPKLMSSVPKSVPKSQSGETRPQQTAFRQMVPKSKRFKSSTGSMPVSKSNNMNMEKNAKSISTVAKSALETDTKPKLFSDNQSTIRNNAPAEIVKKSKMSSENTSVTNSVNKSSEAQRIGGYDSEEHFLLSLASDLRNMPPRQRYDAKIKMINIFVEHSIKSEFST